MQLYDTVQQGRETLGECSSALESIEINRDELPIVLEEPIGQDLTVNCANQLHGIDLHSESRV